MAGSLLDGLGIGGVSEDQIALQTLYPTNDPFKKLQMVSDVKLKMVPGLSVMGVLRRRFKSTILRMWDEEYRINTIPVDRKSRIEAAEILVGRGRAAAPNPDD